MTAHPTPFGALLVRTRKRTGLTQEGLAERSAVSAHTISNLEAGRGHLPRQATIDLLVTALAGALPRGQAELDSLRSAFKEAAGASDTQLRPAEPPMPFLPPTGVLTFLVCALVPGRNGQVADIQTQRSIFTHLAARLLQIMPSSGGRTAGPLSGLGGAVCVFDWAGDAVRTACVLRRDLRTALAPLTRTDGEAPVCLALHTGWAAPGAGDYTGPTWRRAVRLALAGHGGQLLVSQRTRDLVGHALPEGVCLHAAGAVSLSVVERPQPLYQLLQPLQPANFPPPRPLPAAPHNLPVQPTSFIGREREQAAVEALLRQAPLVTLVGAGGCGKTRLALAVAAAVLEDYADGVWLVELASVSEPGLVWQAVATALGVREEAGRPMAATVSEHVKEKRLLLVLDNCEQVVAACAELAANLLRRCPHLHLLATSRERLEISGEVGYRVPSLALPDLEQHPTAEELTEYEAVRLFLERARAARPSFALTVENAGMVAGMCRRLDGIPLAIELAAARVRDLSLEEIAARLGQSIGLLTGGPRDVPPRHQTLRATLDWSWVLLSDPERVLLPRLAIFAGGWQMEAAAVVCAEDAGVRQLVPDVLDVLVDKSLVVLEESTAETRYRLLETVRQYAAERLAETGEQAAVRGRHLDWCVALAEEAELHLTGPEQGTWLGRLEAEHDNLRAALSWARESGAGGHGLRLAGALWRFWGGHGHVREGRMWLDGVLAATADDAPEPSATAAEQRAWQSARGAVLSGAGNLAEYTGDLPRSRALHEEALAARRALGDSAAIASSLGNLANTVMSQGDPRTAEALYDEALSLFRLLGNTWAVAACLSNLGSIATQHGDLDRAKALLDEGLVLRREVRDTWGIAASLTSLGTIALDHGELDQAATLYGESLALRRALGDQRAVAESLSCCAVVELALGKPARAWDLLQEAIGSSETVGDRIGVAIELGIVARALAALDQPAGAAHVLAAAEQLSATLGILLTDKQHRERDTVAGWCASQLSSQALERARLSGADRRLETLLSWILDCPAPSADTPLLLMNFDE